jgi:hypothetical protein
MSLSAAFLFGTLGGLLINVVKLAELSNLPKIERPPTFSDALWIFQFFALPIVGGILAWIYEADGTPLKPLLAMNVGVSAPLILKSLANTVPLKIGKTD